jgi:low affinity Fe/Cu permease
MRELFRHLAKVIAAAIGAPYAFVLAVGVVLLWAVLGPGFGYSDTWQLVINTGTTIMTFLVVFMIQNTQNRDSKAIHLKLDELIRSVESARNGLIDSEDLSDAELARLEDEFADIRKAAGRVPPASVPPEIAKAGDPRRRAAPRSE